MNNNKEYLNYTTKENKSLSYEIIKLISFKVGLNQNKTLIQKFKEYIKINYRVV